MNTPTDVPVILFAWELGGGLGHLAKGLLLAKTLTSAGCEVKFAVRAVREAHRILPVSYGLMQAPLSLATLSNWPSPSSYGELLLHAGFGNAEDLCARVRAWRTLFELGRVNVLIADHAPTALLAAHCSELPTLNIGNGFYFPPQGWPNYRIWESDRPERRAIARMHVLKSMNQCLVANDTLPFGDAGALLETASSAVLTVSELDHYGPRRKDFPYYGHLWLDETGDDPEWPAGSGPAVFAYLRDNFIGRDEVLKALARQKARVLVYGGDGGLFASGSNTSGLKQTSRLVRLDRVAEQAEFVVCSGTDTAHAMALRGVPVLSLPMTAEQRCATVRLRALGLAEQWVNDEPGQIQLDDLVAKLRSPEARLQAKKFKGCHAAHNNRDVVNSLRDACLSIAMKS